MNYVCYYDIIAAVLLSMLFALYFMRRNYPTSTNKAYLAMLICISLSTITDLLYHTKGRYRSSMVELCH